MLLGQVSSGVDPVLGTLTIERSLNASWFEGIATCSGYSVRTGVINLSLQFVKSEVDLRQLGRFAALKGKVMCTRTGDCTTHEGEEE